MKKIIALFLVLTLVTLFLYFNLGSYFTLEQLKIQQASIAAYQINHPVLVALLYVLIYIAVTALSLPGAAILTLTSGAMFGVILGTILASISSTIGATFAFLISRFLIGDSVQSKFADRIEPINKGIERDGAFYLLSLRVVPVFPFFIINAVMGLTKIRIWTYIWVTQVGMLAGTAVYTNAGTQLAKLESLSGILSPALWFSFALLGLFPLLARKLFEWIKSRKSSSISQTDE